MTNRNKALAVTVVAAIGVAVALTIWFRGDIIAAVVALSDVHPDAADAVTAGLRAAVEALLR